ncbi:Rossmann-like alpha/beta/alpha sandwich fold [Sesbania bispinosa]|nr:Rossmann-like alpha/beta/alpha sandwich fold [Sesbania bispinosa]
MAVVSPVPATTQRTRSMGSVREIGGEIVEEPNPAVVDEPIYVAVAKDVKESKLNLIWAIQNSGGKRICILYVHVPATMIPLMGAKFPASSLKEQEVRAFREIERQDMHKTLDEYLRICQRMGVRAEKLHIEMDSIEKGIIELISQHGIRKLVMGAASDKCYSRRMMDLRSKKAIYVREQAPASCHIQFICKGHLIHTRDRSLGERNAEVASPLVHQVPNSVRSLRSQSITLGQNHWENSTNHAQELFRRVRSANDGLGASTVAASSPDDTEGFSTPRNRMGAEVSSDESDRQSRMSPSGLSTYSDGAVEPALTPNLITESSENALDLTLSRLIIKEDLRHSSPPSVLDGGMNDTLYDQLEQAMAEAENATRNAYQETCRRGKAEKDAIEAIRRVTVLLLSASYTSATCR